jgi:hypothetical protein
LHRDTHLVHKPCTRIAKRAPWLPRNRDFFVAKEPGLGTGLLRQPTLTYFIAGPLAQIFHAHVLSPRAVYKIFHIDKKITAPKQDIPLARKTIGLPAAIYMILLTKYQFRILPGLAHRALKNLC